MSALTFVDALQKNVTVTARWSSCYMPLSEKFMLFEITIPVQEAMEIAS